MKILSNLTSLTCKQVALGSAAATTVAVFGFVLAATKLNGIKESTELNGTQKSREGKIDELRKRNIQGYAHYATLFEFSSIFALVGIVFLAGAGLKGTYNWYRS